MHGGQCALEHIRILLVLRQLGDGGDFRHGCAQLMRHTARHAAFAFGHGPRIAQRCVCGLNKRLQLLRGFVECALHRRPIVRQTLRFAGNRAKGLPHHQQAQQYRSDHRRQDAKQQHPVHAALGAIPAFALGGDQQPAFGEGTTLQQHHVITAAMPIR